MLRSQISLQLFRNACKTSLVLLGAASMVFAAAPPAIETESIPLPGDEVGQDDSGRDIAAGLLPLPETYRVQEHYDDRYAGRVAGARGEEKVIYSNTNGQFLFQPRNSFPVADDLITELVRPCPLNTLRVRVNGLVEGGGGLFRARLILYDGCPVSGVGTEIPGTRRLFEDLDDDIEIFHDLVLDFSDRGICDDLSACEVSQQNCADMSVCVGNPLQIPPTVWVRIQFDTDQAAILVGSPPTIGFSSDGYDHPFGRCSTWFGGWPAFPHASFWVELTAPSDCETHFLAYSAGNPNLQPFLPAGIAPPDVGTPPTRLGDDIRLSVDDCILSAFEIGMKGLAGPFEMSIDLRWPDLDGIHLETEHIYHGRGEGSFEVARFTIPPEIELSIGRLDQPIYLTWAANRSNTGAIDVHETQIGFSGPEFFVFDTDDQNSETWDTVFNANGSPAVFYAAVYCRGETPRGACCPDQPEVPGLDLVCFDDLPVTSCLGQRWLANTTCDENLFDPPCGTHACCLPDGSCDNIVREECFVTCDTLSPPLVCQIDQDCPGERTCGTDTDANRCTPVCAKWSTGKFCGDADFECPQPCEIGDITTIFFADHSEIDPSGPPILNCAIDARQPHDLNDAGLTFGWDRMVMQLACNAATVPWSVFDFHVTSSGGNIENRPASLVFDDMHARLSVVLADRIPPGEWTCIEHVESGNRWCAGYLPGDANQDRLVTAGDINALIDSINLVPGRVLPNYASDMNRSGVTTTADILRLIDLLNGAGEFDPWIARSLPPCPSEE